MESTHFLGCHVDVIADSCFAAIGEVGYAGQVEGGYDCGVVIRGGLISFFWGREGGRRLVAHPYIHTYEGGDGDVDSAALQGSTELTGMRLMLQPSHHPVSYSEAQYHPKS